MTNSPTEKKPLGRRILRVVLIVLLVLLLLLALAVGGMAWLIHTGRNAMVGQTGPITVPSDLVDQADGDGRHITYKGEHYVLNENAVSVLFLGVDKDDVSQNFGYGKNGQADSLFLAVMDVSTGEVQIIPLSRECMTEVKYYSAEGAYVGTETAQLCLAYAYGSTGEESCTNVVSSVRQLLYGVDVDAYVAIDLNGVAVLSDKIGGISLTSLENVSIGKRVYFVEGEELLLKGKQACDYIQLRGDDVNANNRRLRRQRQFLEKFFQKGKETLRNDPTCVVEYYNAALPYLVTDMDLARISFLAEASLTAPGTAMHYLDIQGETVMGEKYVEFYPDPASLYEAVLQAFYLKEP